MPNWVTNQVKFKNHESCLKFKELLIRDEEVERYGEKKVETNVDFNALIPIAKELKNSTSNAIDYSKAKEYHFEFSKEQDRLVEELEELILPLYESEYSNNDTCEGFKNSILAKYKEVEGVLEQLVKIGYEDEERQNYFTLSHAESYYLFTKYGYGDWYKAQCDLWGTKWNSHETDFIEDSDFCYFQTAWSCPVPIFEKLAELGVEFSVGYADEDTGSNCGLFTTKEGKLELVVGYGKNNEKELLTFAVLLNYENLEDYIDGMCFDAEDEDDKEQLAYLESCQFYEEEMLNLIREYEVVY